MTVGNVQMVTLNPVTVAFQNNKLNGAVPRFLMMRD